MTERSAFLASVKDFARETVAPAAALWSQGRAPDAGVFLAAAKLGLFGIELPVHAGGLGLDFKHKAAACRILAAADFGFAMAVVNTHNVALRLFLSAPDLANGHLAALLSGETCACTALTEPDAGTDAAAMRTRASETDDGWVLNGEKTWIVNGRRAGLAIVFAKCGDSDDHRSIGAFLVDLTAPGVERHAIDSAFAQTSTGTGGFTMRDVRLARGNLILPPGKAFRSILSEINGARAYVAAMCCGMLEAAVATVAAHGHRRFSFGKPLMEHQAWRLALAQAGTDLDASAALTDKAIAAIPGDHSVQRLAAQAKIHAVQTCQQHLPGLLHAMGAEGLRPEHCLARHLAAVQSAALTDGAQTPLLERVSKLSFPSQPALED
ncbi:acyl-CoA dehydrogenase [Zhengella mangrovi]|uniref:Medium-chain specific acyl-CoA dehydrogenase, mitochondrial n=1 Tax=Zhengella mangrovi TaxID=1982044 RepID=A0A2G1QHQ2_9HYPH|nr:acyl-CoA dehydrogenase family protein [Zhengella mangrovi]PHP64984.1 acyl-CoA dehydrogenase [Zhengella mangrovi]